MAMSPDPTVLDCPGCTGKIELPDMRIDSIRCPGCGAEWLLSVQDAPGSRIVIDLLPKPS
jgi:hypothetical protein